MRIESMSKKLDNRYDKNVFCPFYKGTEGGQTIRCESPITGTVIRLGFSRRSKCKEYIENFCYEKTCAGCPIYQCTNAKYEEE